MTKKDRARERRASRGAGRQAAAGSVSEVEALLMAPVFPVSDVKHYATFTMDGKQVPLFWCDPGRCKRDFDDYFECLQTSTGELELQRACETYPEVVASMQAVMPNAEGGGDEAEAVRVCWQQARTIMLCATREYCVQICRGTDVLQ